MNSQYAAPAPDPEILRPGDVIQQWTVVGLLSQGGMGDIYEVRHQYLRTTAALKLLKAEFASSTSALTRIRREARIGANLKHPNLNLVYDGGEHRSQPYFLMDLLEASRPPSGRGRLLHYVISCDASLNCGRVGMRVSPEA